MVEVHNRMPVILEHDVFDSWLDPDSRDTDSLRRLLLPAPGGTLESYPISTEVNSPRHDGPQLLIRVEPVADGVAQLDL
jgi:putative SOS response-associated peptidase YedK